jgi:hypothetical protein
MFGSQPKGAAMSTRPKPRPSIEQIIRGGSPSEQYAALAAATLKGRKTTELMDLYREAKRIGSIDASEARRWITVELLKRLPRSAVIAFEDRVANEMNERAIEAREGDIYVTREGGLYTRQKIVRVQHRRKGAIVEITLPKHTYRVLDGEQLIVVEREPDEFPAPGRSDAQVDCLSHLSKDHDSLTAWNMIAGGDVVCQFADDSIIRVGIDGRYFRTHRAALKKHNEAQGTAIKALSKRKGPLLEYMPRLNGDVLVQFSNGSIFLMAEDGRCVPAPRSALAPLVQGNR